MIAKMIVDLTRQMHKHSSIISRNLSLFNRYENEGGTFFQPALLSYVCKTAMEYVGDQTLSDLQIDLVQIKLRDPFVNAVHEGIKGVNIEINSAIKDICNINS